MQVRVRTWASRLSWPDAHCAAGSGGWLCGGGAHGIVGRIAWKRSANAWSGAGCKEQSETSAINTSNRLAQRSGSIVVLF